MPLSDIVNVVFTLQNPGVTAQGFGIPLILSHSAAWVERTRTYSSIADVADDFAVTTPEYRAANAIFSQSPAPPTIMIGRAANVPTQRFAVGAQNATVAASYAVDLSAPSGSAIVTQEAKYVAAASAAWIASTPYITGQLVTNDTGKGYICITAGTSAGSGGPTGTAADITDGTVHWMYANPTAIGAANNDAIVYNLKKQIDAFAAPVVAVTCSLQGSVGAKTLRILANTAGAYFGVSVVDMATLSLAQDHADPGVAADLTAIALESSAWYGLVTLFNSKALVVAAAAWVESNTKLYIAASADSAVATDAESGASDVFHALKAASYARTGPFFHPLIDEFADAAEIGRFFPIDPGGDNWRLKTLAGVTVQSYTSTWRTNIEDKHGNFYYDLGGANVIGGDGKVSSNEYIDVIRFRDWYVARLSERLVNLLIQNDKIPYTDDGVALIEAEVRAQNDEGIQAGGIAASPAPVVSVPKVANVSSANKAARRLNNVNTNWTLAGAINSLRVNVQVSV